MSLSCLCCVFRSEVNVTLCHDHPLRNFQLTCRSHNGTCTGTCNITGFANRSSDADRTCVCCRQFYLIGTPERTQNGNVRQFLLRSNDRYAFFTGKLTRLRQHLLDSQFLSLTEQHCECFRSQMYVSCRCFNNKLFRHGVIPPINANRQCTGFLQYCTTFCRFRQGYSPIFVKITQPPGCTRNFHIS